MTRVNTSLDTKIRGVTIFDRNEAEPAAVFIPFFGNISAGDGPVTFQALSELPGRTTLWKISDKQLEDIPRLLAESSHGEDPPETPNHPALRSDPTRRSVNGIRINLAELYKIDATDIRPAKPTRVGPSTEAPNETPRRERNSKPGSEWNNRTAS
ncbi:hypothetical protein HanRHA438_Chr14g0675191 [Helianthus annuus]|nr:hypothetical protein HanRHA438_Chr14g0675191 [Helianthus annuus]